MEILEGYKHCGNWAYFAMSPGPKVQALLRDGSLSKCMDSLEFRDHQPCKYEPYRDFESNGQRRKSKPVSDLMSIQHSAVLFPCCVSPCETYVFYVYQTCSDLFLPSKYRLRYYCASRLLSIEVSLKKNEIPYKPQPGTMHVYAASHFPFVLAYGAGLKFSSHIPPGLFHLSWHMYWSLLSAKTRGEMMWFWYYTEYAN
ncbi:Uncharacterized protein Fot_30799 [Forsythia ovata]|uniref:Uncharacterized protein n=1 Tax=Forsythia ovata TaxID=205694 RepID=A0ABD1T3B1_9LAMI